MVVAVAVVAVVLLASKREDDEPGSWSGDLKEMAAGAGLFD